MMVLERGTISVQPGSEDNTAATRRLIGNQIAEEIHQAGVLAFGMVGDMNLSHVNINFIQCEIVFYPFETFA